MATTHEFKTNCASIFVSHKGPTHMLNTFIHTSHGLRFKNNIGFHYVHCNASK
jgi:hypothetical protein